MVSAVLSFLVFVSCVLFLPTIWADDCSSYWDDSGVRHDGLQCGGMDCCGTCSMKYCCTKEQSRLTQEQQEICDDMPRFAKFSRTAIVLGSILGTVLPIIFCVGLITCFVVPCCCLYKKCRKQHNSRRRQNVTSTFVAAPHQPASPPHPSHPSYQPVPVHGGPAMPTAPVGPPPYIGPVPPAYTPLPLPPRPNEHPQPPYNPAYGFKP
ncbi:protein shisa-5-like [Syngnathus acus]|uniref:protein shisa-5-like n=1 Tax=Syngnathus acus TaxID=161584 RepID=UPI0018864C92|nr:protein shisa-5-like [Syngnathus acus]